MKVNKDLTIELQPMEIEVLKNAALLSIDEGKLYRSILEKLSSGKILVEDFTANELIGIQILLRISYDYLKDLSNKLEIITNTRQVNRN